MDSSKTPGPQKFFDRLRETLLLGIVSDVPTGLLRDANEDGAGNSWLVVLLLTTYIIFVVILLLNLLIAMMGNTYQNVECNSQRRWLSHCPCPCPAPVPVLWRGISDPHRVACSCCIYFRVFLYWLWALRLFTVCIARMAGVQCHHGRLHAPRRRTLRLCIDRNPNPPPHLHSPIPSLSPSRPGFPFSGPFTVGPVPCFQRPSGGTAGSVPPELCRTVTTASWGG